MKTCSQTVLLSLTLLLAACGGGSGGSSGPSQPVTPTPPVEEEPTRFSISGFVNVSANLSVDGDTNNPEAALTSNNTVASAQPISNPATLGGYVGQPGTGQPGAVQSTGDIDDFFRVELLAGQSVTLLVADFEQADADLYLYNLDGEILDFSVEIGQVESLSIPADGIYVVNVFAFAGATNYALAVGTNNAPAREIAARSANAMAAAKIIPWQAVVKQRAPNPDSPATNSQKDLRGRMGMHSRAGGRHSGGRHSGARPRPHLMGMDRTGLSQRQLANRLGLAKGRELRLGNPELRARWETLMTIKSLRHDPDIIFAEPNYRVQASATPDDEAYPFQWHFPLINLPAAWDLTTGDPGVIVAVIDTGILSGHPDLAGQLVQGYDFIADPQRARDGTGIDPNPEDVGDSTDLGGSSFHGSHVSGTIAAASDNGVGVAGVAWNVRIMPLRVLGVDGGSTYDVAQAVRYAAGLPNDSGTVPLQRADVINLSLGGAPFSQSSQAVYEEARAAGVIVVAASGNEASSVPGYPASYSGVISVGAVDSQRRLAPYSNFGRRIDVAAPGGNNGIDINGDGYPDGVLSTAGSASASGINFVYTFFNGTSMASPHVAGVLALMKSVNPELTPADIDALLAQGELTDDLGSPGRDDRFGHGLINAERAVVAALSAAGNPPADNPNLRASSSLLNFGSAAQTLDLALQNSGRGELELLELSSSESWAIITPDEVDSAGLGRYRITVDRAGLVPGLYSAQISAISNVNTLSVDILISVVSEQTGGDVGLVYLLLIDESTGEAVAQFTASGRTGIYNYQFTDIAAGSYQIFAGTDADNDLIICDAGEACGAYLTTDQPVSIDLASDLENVEFPLEYRVIIPTLDSLSQQPERESNDGIPRTP